MVSQTAHGRGSCSHGDAILCKTFHLRNPNKDCSVTNGRGCENCYSLFRSTHVRIERMARRQTPFPFPPLPRGEIRPSPGPGDPQQLLQRDIQIVRWFIEDRESRRIKPSPLADLLEAHAQMDLNGPSRPIEDVPAQSAQFTLHATAHFFRLAWAIRALYGNESVE